MVYVLLGSGFEESEAVVPVDLMRRAGIPVALVGLEGEYVTSSHGITVRADCTLEKLDPEAAELIFLPGGLGGVDVISRSGRALSILRSCRCRVAAICAAPSILAGLGLLEGRRAVIYPGMEDEMDGAMLELGVPVVVDGPYITGEAAGSSFQFGLKLVALLRGTEAAEQVREAIHFRG